jgi:hypothetical protein
MSCVEASTANNRVYPALVFDDVSVHQCECAISGTGGLVWLLKLRFAAACRSMCCSRGVNPSGWRQLLVSIFLSWGKNYGDSAQDDMYGLRL